MTLALLLVILASLLNVAAAVLNIRTGRRSRQVVTNITGEYSRLVAFAAYMKVSGPTPQVRAMAASALPPSVTITMEPGPPPSGHVH